MIAGSPAAHRRRIIALVALALVLAGWLGWIVAAQLAPSAVDDAGADETALGPPPRMTIENGIAVLTLSAAEQRNAGIETTRPSPAPAQRSVGGYGSVLDAAPLTDLDNRYLEAETQAKTASARLAVSRAAFARAKLLYRDQQNISAAQLEGAEGNFAVDEAVLAAARARLGSVAASARQAWGNVLGAALIDHAPLIADLIARRCYLVRVTLPPGVTVAAPPEKASVRLSGAAQIPLALISPAPTTNPKLQGISYFYRAPGEGGLVPGLTLEVSLPAGTVERGLVVPEAAVVWLQGKAWVYLRTGATAFVRRQIAADRAAADGGYIVEDLPPQPDIVVRGAQMLLSEEFRAQVPVED